MKRDAVRFGHGRNRLHDLRETGIRDAVFGAAKDRQEAAEALAAAETTAREKAQAHAAVLRKRSLVLRAVLAVALLIAAAAVYGFVTATKETHTANERTREALGLTLTNQGQAMLAGIQGGGDIRALLQILAAQRVVPDRIGGLFTAALMRVDTDTIIQSNAAIMDVTFSSDGHRIVSGGADHTVRVWNTDTGQPVGAQRVLGVCWTLWAELRFYLLFALAVVWPGATRKRVLMFCALWMLGAVLADASGQPFLRLMLMPDYAPAGQRRNASAAPASAARWRLPERHRSRRRP